MILNKYLDDITKEAIEANLEIVKEKKALEYKIKNLPIEKEIALSILLEKSKQEFISRDLPMRIIFSNIEKIINESDNYKTIENHIKKLLDLGVPKENIKEVCELILKISGIRSARRI